MSLHQTDVTMTGLVTVYTKNYQSVTAGGRIVPMYFTFFQKTNEVVAPHFFYRGNLHGRQEFHLLRGLKRLLFRSHQGSHRQYTRRACTFENAAMYPQLAYRET